MHKIQLDMISVTDAETLARQFGVEMKVIEEFGPGGGLPLCEFTGEYDKISNLVKDYDGDNGDYDFLMKSVEMI